MPSRAARRVAHRSSPDKRPCAGSLQGRCSRRSGWVASPRYHHSRSPEAARLCYRTVRQKPSRRPQRIFADRAWVRRVFGNLYHLNAEEEPENFDYPHDPAFRDKFGPRGVLRCKATDVDDPTEDPGGAASVSRRSKTLARSPKSAWRRSTTRHPAAAVDF